METKLYTPPVKNDCKLVFRFCYPAIKSFALSSLGYLWLLKEAEMLEDVCVEAVAFDSGAPKYEADIIAFSFSFDFDFLQIFKMIESFGLSLKASERNEKDPLIFCGGPVVSSNPEPYSEIFDFFVIGDGEGVNDDFNGVNRAVLDIVKKNKDKSKREILELLAQIEGVYVPKISQAVKKVTQKLEKCVYSTILSDEAFFKNTFVIEIERGCTNMCRFCLASFLNLPIRFVDFEKLKRVIDLGLSYTNKIAFLGAQISAHPQFHELCAFIREKDNVEMNFSSLRIDAITPDVIKTLIKCGQKTTTLAIEAGSERLRKFINKNISEEQIFSAVKIAHENGLKGIKFYAMIGLPTETQTDIDELIKLAKRLKSQFKGFDISFGISTFVPKAHTPFQWYGREDIKSLEKKSDFIKKEFHKLGIQVTISSVKWDYWQAVLSRGDNSLTDLLIDTYKSGGKIGNFKSSAKRNYINTDFFAQETWDIDTKLPWNFIELTAPPKEFLKSKFLEYNQ